MSRGYKSPEVVYIENEQKLNTTAVEETIVGIIGPATKGPFEPTEVSTVKKLHEIFGYAVIGENADGTKVFSKAIAAAERILKYSKNVLFCRLPLSDSEMGKFVIKDAENFPELEFTVCNNDCDVNAITLTQHFNNGVYTYDVTLHSEDVLGDTSTQLCSGVSKEELKTALEYTELVKDVTVGTLPMALPSEVTSHISFPGVVNEDDAISFEVKQDPENTDHTYVCGTGVRTVSDTAMTIDIIQPEEVPSKVYDVTTGTDADPTGKGLKVEVIQEHTASESKTFTASDKIVMDTFTADVKLQPITIKTYTVAQKTGSDTDGEFGDPGYFYGIITGWVSAAAASKVTDVKVETTATAGTYKVSAKIESTWTDVTGTSGASGTLKTAMESQATWAMTDVVVKDQPIDQTGATRHAVTTFAVADNATAGYDITATIGGTLTTIGTGVAAENILTTINGYSSGSEFENATRKEGVSDRDFPIVQPALDLVKAVKVKKNNDGTYDVLKQNVNLGTVWESVFDTSAIGFTYPTAATLVSSVNATTATKHIKLTAQAADLTDTKIYPIVQLDPIEFKSIRVIKDTVNNVYSVYCVNANDTLRTVALNRRADKLIETINAEGTLRAYKGDAFPIAQPAEKTIYCLKIEKNGIAYDVKVATEAPATSSTPITYDKTLCTAISKSALLSTLSTQTVVPLTNVTRIAESDANFPIVQPDSDVKKSYGWAVDPLQCNTESVDSFEYFNNAEALDVSVLLAPFGDLAIRGKSTTAAKEAEYDKINTKLLNVAAMRGDCMVILDYPEEYADGSQLGAYEKFKAMFGGAKYVNKDEPNACTLFPLITYKNPYVNEEITLPASAIMACQMVYTDQVKHCWFAPAGFGDRKGVVPDATGITKQLTKEERDELYDIRVNPLMNFVGQGIVVWGNRTMKRTSKYESDSCYVQINVRRLANYIKKVVVAQSMSTLFEPNDSTTWQAWKNKIRPRLREIQNNRGCEAFKIIMDRSTISDDDIANGRCPAVIMVMPTSAIEYIPITFTMTRDSVIFGEEEQ